MFNATVSGFKSFMRSFMVSLLNSTDTVEEFEDRIMQKKMKIPKMSIKNSGNSFENCYGEERMPLRHKKVGCADTRRPQECPFIPIICIVSTFTTNNQNHHSIR